MKAIIYTRYSPQKNGKDKDSCEVQAAYCEEYAAKKKWEVGGIYEDKEKSGKDDERPGLWAAIRGLEKGDVLLVWKLDRLARSVYLMERIKKDVKDKKARIVAVEGDIEGNTPEARMVRGILSFVAEYEREIIGQRTSAAMRHQQKNGKYLSGKPPYGYCVEDGKLVEVIEEQRAITYIEMMWLQRQKTMEIVQAMNKSEYKTRTGRAWMRRDVERIISNLTTVKDK